MSQRSRSRKRVARLLAFRGLERIDDEPEFAVAKAPVTLKGQLQAGDQSGRGRRACACLSA